MYTHIYNSNLSGTQDTQAANLSYHYMYCICELRTVNQHTNVNERTSECILTYTRVHVRPIRMGEWYYDSKASKV